MRYKITRLFQEVTYMFCFIRQGKVQKAKCRSALWVMKPAPANGTGTFKPTELQLYIVSFWEIIIAEFNYLLKSKKRALGLHGTISAGGSDQENLGEERPGLPSAGHLVPVASQQGMAWSSINSGGALGIRLGKKGLKTIQAVRRMWEQQTTRSVKKEVEEVLQMPQQKFPCNLWRGQWWSRLSPCSSWPR